MLVVVVVVVIVDVDVVVRPFVTLVQWTPTI